MWFRRIGLAALGLCVFVSAAAAQVSRATQSSAAGERYTVEAGIFLWQPTPQGIVEAEYPSIVGTSIDLVADLGVEKKQLPEVRFVLHPARKHKFRVSYLPLHYTADTTLSRTLVFNGATFRVSSPVSTDFDWKAWRFTYEYDFVSRPRGFVGFLLEAKYTDVSLDVATPLIEEIVSARVPIPAIGGIFRVYPASHFSITGEVSGFKLPGNLFEGEDSVHYLDWDLYGTVNFTNNVGAQAGYRTLDLAYRHNEDFGDLLFKGFYFGGVVRF